MVEYCRNEDISKTPKNMDDNCGHLVAGTDYWFLVAVDTTINVAL